MRIECVLDCGDVVGEGPVWDGPSGTLYWVDIIGRRIQAFVPATGEHRIWSMPDWVSALALRQGGKGMVVALRTGVFLFDPETGALDELCRPDPDPDNRMNDAKCDPQGRFWCGTMQNNINDDGSDREIVRHSGSLFRVDPDGSFERFMTALGIANTFAWSPDRTTMYTADTLTREIYAWDYDDASGAIGNRRVFARITEHGNPDGSTMDVHGHLWNCRFAGGGILRIAPDGRVVDKITMPVTNVTSATFGGPDLDVLYVTTARVGLSGEELARQPRAGGLFAVHAGIAGLPDTRFAG
jgi:L-arabinonolactonase